MVGRCAATTAAGSPCSAQPVRADGYCYWHSPALAAERAEARRRGGQAKSNVNRAKRALLPAAMTVADMEVLLDGVLRAVINGRLTPGIAVAAATVAKAKMQAAEVGRLEAEQAELRSLVGRGRAS